MAWGRQGFPGGSTQSPTLCDPMDCGPPVSSINGILQARILEWVALLSSRDLPYPGIEPTSLMSSALAGGFFTTRATWEATTASATLSLRIKNNKHYLRGFILALS